MLMSCSRAGFPMASRMTAACGAAADASSDRPCQRAFHEAVDGHKGPFAVSIPVPEFYETRAHHPFKAR